jgi:hypothetical protein
MFGKLSVLVVIYTPMKREWLMYATVCGYPTPMCSLNAIPKTRYCTSTSPALAAPSVVLMAS